MAYDPPIGIPNPAARWGSFGEINQATPAWPTSWTDPIPSDTVGYYYIDKTAVGATNTLNPYGNPSLPRLTPPEGNLTAVPAKMIYIHAGTYTATDSGGDRFDWSGVYTDTDPLWITGNPATKPIFQDFIHIGLSPISGAVDTCYVVFENFEISGTTTSKMLVGPSSDGRAIHHILIRNCKLRGTQSTGDSSGMQLGVNSATDTYPATNIHDLVAYNNDIADYGEKSTSDRSGIYNGMHTDHIYVLDNLITNVAADGIAGSHYSNTTDRISSNYFIGRNISHENGENGIDIKGIQGGVISQNEIYGPFFRAEGAGIVLHYGATPSTACANIQVIFNKLHHCGMGILNGGSKGNDNGSYIGNIFYDMDSANAATPNAAWGGYCIQIGGSLGTIRIADNIFYDYEGGIITEDINIGVAVKIHGNVSGAKNGTLKHDLHVVSGAETRHSIDYSIYGSTPNFFWSNAVRDLTYMKGTALQEAHGLNVDPLFVSPPLDLTYQDGSPAINSSVEGPVGDTAYDNFFSLFGENIEVDFVGTARPHDGIWDRGAYEFTAGPVGSIINLIGSLAFGNVIIGDLPTATLTISNTGDEDFTVTSITYPTGFTGAYAGTVVAGGSHDVTVTFTPLDVIVYGGTVTVNSDAESGINTTTASGTGVLPGSPGKSKHKRKSMLISRVA